MAVTQRGLRLRPTAVQNTHMTQKSIAVRRWHYTVWRRYLPLWMLAANRQMHEPDNSTGIASKPLQSSVASSFEAFFHQHERNLFSYLWRMTSDEQAASDLCQEAFLRAWQHFGKVSTYEQPAAWLFRVATNLALNHLRLRPRRKASTTFVDNDNDMSSAIASGDMAAQVTENDAIRRALMALAPRQRAALILREVYGLSCDEIAQALSMSRGAAKTLLWRSRDAFRNQYTREGGDL